MILQLRNSLFFSLTEPLKYLTQDSGVHEKFLNSLYESHHVENGMHKVFDLQPKFAIVH